jgi:hypothetical protein
LGAENTPFFKLGSKVENYPSTTKYAVHIIPVTAIRGYEFVTFKIKRQNQSLRWAVVSNSLGVFRKHQFETSPFVPNEIRISFFKIHYLVYGLIAPFE